MHNNKISESESEKIWNQKGHGHDTDEWRDYDEDNVPFERLEKVYVPDEDSLEQRMNIFHGQLYSLYRVRDNRKFRLPLQLLLFW